MKPANRKQRRAIEQGNPTARKEIEAGAISLGEKVTVREFPKSPGKFMVHLRGEYVGYVTPNGEPRISADTPEFVSQRVEAWVGHG